MKKYFYNLSIVAFFSLLFWVLPSYLRASETLQKVSLNTRDIFFKIRQISSDSPSRIGEVLVVAIDDESCEKLQERWPWSRAIFAVLINELSAKGAKVIGLNISFTGLESGSEATSRELAAALRKHGHVVIGAAFDKANRLVNPLPVIADSAARIGYLEKIVDLDYAIRRSYLLRLYKGHAGFHGSSFESSFPLQLVAAYGRDDELADPRFNQDLGIVTVGVPPVSVFVDDDGSYTINYLVPESEWRQISAWKVIQGKVSEKDIHGKYVFVGLTSALFSELHPTPLGMMSGAGIHANEFLAILSGRALKFVPQEIVFFVSWLAALAVLILFLARRFLFGLFCFAAVLAALFLMAQIVFSMDYVIEPFILIAGPSLGALTGILGHSLKLLFENKGLEKKVVQDKMTGLYTYDYLRSRLEEEWKRSKKMTVPVSIVMTDLDRFKKINDTLGHEVGNQMILKAAAVIKESIRGYDVVSRYGGDEFVILLWRANRKDAQEYRSRLREQYHAMAKKLEPALQDSSISIGVSTFDPLMDPKHPENPQRLIEEADQDLLTDKESRRKTPADR